MKFKIKKDIDVKQLDRFKHKAGMKNSMKRAFIVAYFLAQDRHYSIEELHQEIKGIKRGLGYSTIYRALKLLSKCGLASECDFADGVRRFEPLHSAKHHDHLVCQKCGRVIEFENDEIENLQQEVARKNHFQVQSHELKIFGVCALCQKKTKKKKRKLS